MCIVACVFGGLFGLLLPNYEEPFIDKLAPGPSTARLNYDSKLLFDSKILSQKF